MVHNLACVAFSLPWASPVAPRCTLVVRMGVASAERLAGGPRGAGLAGETPVAISERGTTPYPRTLLSTPGTLPAHMAQWNPRPPARLIIGRMVGRATASMPAQLLSEAVQ